MTRIHYFLSSLLLGLLLILVVVIQVKLSPVLSQAMLGYGDSLWVSARLSVVIGNLFAFLIPLLFAAVILGFRLAQPEWKLSILTTAGIIVAILLALQITLFLNFISSFIGHLGKGNFTSKAVVMVPDGLTPSCTRTPPALPFALSQPLANSASLVASVQAGPVSFIR